jgi:hypothetical protein
MGETVLTVNLDRLAKYFKGAKKKPSAGVGKYTVIHTDADVPELRPQTRDERIKSKRIEVSEQRDRNWERYVEARNDRKRRLQEAQPGVKRYLRHLDNLARSQDFDARGKNDCDVDIAELAARCGIPSLPSDRDIWFVYELTSEWLFNQRKRQLNGKIPVCDDDDFFRPGDPFAGTAIGELRELLKIR